jgi:arsenate reductase
VLLTRRQLLAEFLGTALLAVAVVGSGIAAARLTRGDLGLELFESAAATGAALVAIILALGPVSGAHLNPVITAVDRLEGGITTRAAVGYWGAQVAGGISGAVLANLMFALPAVELSRHARSGSGLWLAEAVATFGLVLVVFGLARSGRSALAPFAVGAYIAGGYFFTASTSFANPAVTIARMFSDTFAGIAPASVPAFVGFQFLGGAVAVAALVVLYPGVSDAASDVVVPHPTEDAA